MKQKFFLFICLSLLTISCHVDDADNWDYNDRQNTILSCAKPTDTAGIQLISFKPFTEEEMKTMAYDEKVAQRQIPDHLLKNMQTKELFYQFVCCELSGDIYLFNTEQAGFLHAAETLNMVSELLARADAGSVLLHLTNGLEPEMIETDCFHYYECLLRTIVQPEIIQRMTDEEINELINLFDRHRNTPANLTVILFGYGNILLKYEYEPFVNLMQSNNDLAGFMSGAQIVDERVASLITECITGFGMK
jgi:hypothetical protein